MSEHHDDETVGITRTSLILLAIGAALLVSSIAAAGTICYACLNPAFPS